MFITFWTWKIFQIFVRIRDKVFKAVFYVIFPSLHSYSCTSYAITQCMWSAVNYCCYFVWTINVPQIQSNPSTHMNIINFVYALTSAKWMKCGKFSRYMWCLSVDRNVCVCQKPAVPYEFTTCIQDMPHINSKLLLMIFDILRYWHRRWVELNNFILWHTLTTFLIVWCTNLWLNFSLPHSYARLERWTELESVNGCGERGAECMDCCQTFIWFISPLTSVNIY